MEEPGERGTNGIERDDCKAFESDEKKKNARFTLCLLDHECCEAFQRASDFACGVEIAMDTCGLGNGT